MDLKIHAQQIRTEMHKVVNDTENAVHVEAEIIRENVRVEAGVLRHGVRMEAEAIREAVHAEVKAGTDQVVHAVRQVRCSYRIWISKTLTMSIDHQPSYVFCSSFL